MLLTNYTCVDVASVVGKLSRCTHNLSLEHWDAISRLLRYLKSIYDFGLSYCGYLVVIKDIMMLIGFLIQMR
jgi:hypothetical protein